MERISVPEIYQQPTPHHQSTTTIERDDWYGVPYKPNPTCPVCKGAGILHPRDGLRIVYSKVVPCRAHGCLYDSVSGRTYDQAQKQTFESFIVMQGNEQAFKHAKSLAEGKSKHIWQLIYGQPGNGKTHLGRAIVRGVHDRGLEARMILIGDLFEYLREAIREHKADETLRRLKDCEFLVIDDYGVEYGSEWEQAKFDELMTSRYATAKPTVLITNKDLGGLPPRVMSRFNDKVMSRVTHNTAGDFRAKRK